MIGINKGALRPVNPNLKLELKFNSQVYTDLAGTVAANTNDYVRAWKSSVGGHLFTQSTDAARPQRQSDGLYFDGGDTLGGPIGTINSRSAWTFEWWQYELSQSGFQTPIYLYSPATVYVSFNASTVYLSDGVTNTISAAAITRTLNAWIHNAVSFDATTYRFYRGGVQAASSTTLLAAGNLSNAFLQSFNGSSLYINGRISDFRIYTACIYPSGTTFTPPTRSA